MVSAIVDYAFPEGGNGPYRLFRGIEKGLVERFLGTLSEPRRAQQQRLAAILSQASGTAFGDAHGLSPSTSLESFREQVPVRGYDALSDWMGRMHAGEHGVLTREPVRSLLKTSGTTGASKLLPVTDSYAKEVREGQSLWRLALLRDHEAVRSGKALTVVSKAIEGRLPSGLPFGSNTGRMQDEQPFMVRLRYPVPRAVADISDTDARLYTLLRFALQAPISTLTTANPSTVLLLCRKLLEFQDDLARDLAEGTCVHGPAVPLPLLARVRLSKAAVPEDWRPARIWDLETVNCWKGGPASYFLARFGDALGAEVAIREVGLTASEGYFAIPMSDGDEGGVAWLGGHLLEFLDDDDAPHWAWELELGKQYRLVVSTSAGLYRYDLNDVVEVTGFVDAAPLLRFVRKGRSVLSVTGEKVSEEQVVALIARHAPKLRGFTLGVRMGEVPTYVLAVEGDPAGLQDFDAALRGANVEYDEKRKTQRLGEAEVLVLAEGTYARHREARVAAGAPHAQLKDLVLAVTAEEWDELIRASRS